MELRLPENGYCCMRRPPSVVWVSESFPRFVNTLMFQTGGGPGSLHRRGLLQRGSWPRATSKQANRTALTAADRADRALTEPRYEDKTQRVP